MKSASPINDWGQSSHTTINHTLNNRRDNNPKNATDATVGDNATRDPRVHRINALNSFQLA